MLARSVCIAVLVVAVGVGGTDLTGISEAKASKYPVSFSPAPLPPALATGALGLDLLRTLPPGNVVLSPDSIATALAMAGSGARGETARQIAETLHLKGPADFARVGRLQRAIVAGQDAVAPGDPEAPTLNLGNGLFVQQGFFIEPSFLSGLQAHFGASPETVDFENDPIGALGAVNAWASDRTEGLIPQLLREPLSELTRLVLLNAVYLNAKWLRPFDPSDSAPASFHNRNRTTTAQFMHERERLLYGSGRDYSAVELPYRDSDLSMLIMLPRRNTSVGALQRHLGARRLARTVAGLRDSLVELSLPRFHLATQATLNGVLKSLGMPVAFSEAADFSRITADTSLKIGLVEHAADLKVDEGGTVAAAATAVVIERKSKPRGPVTFNANRPFLFFLRDGRTGAVLFAGRLADPASAEA